MPPTQAYAWGRILAPGFTAKTHSIFYCTDCKFSTFILFIYFVILNYARRTGAKCRQV
jgi:hypothetical protein